MKKLTALPILLFSMVSHAASYDTLPVGINTFVFKQVMTNKIESKYDANNSNKTLLINENFTTSKLSGISDAINTYFEELKKLSPSAYESFSYGTFEARAWAQVNAQGIGFGRGITDHLTVYGSLPFYHLKSTVNFYQKSGSNLSQIKSSVITTTPNTALGTFIKQLTLQLPDSNESLLQSVIVNYYHYKPLGTWEKDAIGDAEIGAIYRLTDNPDYGTAITLGTVLPTGSPDDPNNIQDISSGDGQADVFIESNSGINFLDGKLKFDLTGRFTYQIAANKEVRLYDDPDVPLSDKTGILSEKLGNKLDLTIASTYSPNIYLNFVGGLIFSETGKSNYSIEDQKIKNALESGTNTTAKWAKVGLNINTIEMYKRKIFEIPFEVGLSAQKLLNAQNTANYTRFDLDLKFYF